MSMHVRVYESLVTLAHEGLFEAISSPLLAPLSFEKVHVF